MKRTNFLQTCLAATAIVAAPFNALAKSVKKFLLDTGFMVSAGKDRNDKSLSLFEGDTFDCKVATKDTNGDIYVFESKRIKEGGPAHHYHFTQDEWWYVLQGEFLIKVGETVYKAKAGDSVFGPRMIPHSFAKVGEGEAKLLMFFQPAGKMEEFFTKMSQGLGKNLTEAEQDKFREEHGFKRVGPPIKQLKW
ncbi:Cupin domain-containing protein [Chryseolinea serpens]|uniref:Cupin domain-containing protein n=1 Tax=Chryseolinea serpens TaxID=947013 RepID=A0A1M5QV56_9BACT|nr:cupin domain-containing protein [Chryseolinea serpens]SHH18005.1 Cupin domain-containing protein [Chryseolinea serpens]